MYLTKSQGKYIPSYDSDKLLSDKISEGEEVYCTQKRNIGYHRKGFSLLRLGFQNQDTYENMEIYRQILTMKAGFVHFVEGTDKKIHPLPKSLSFEKMSQKEFEEWYGAILEIISKEIGSEKAEIEAELSGYY